MWNSLTSALQEWNSSTDGRTKLQHTYIVITISLVLAAGVIGLINYSLGQMILFGAFVAVAAFLANAVVWALLQSFVLLRIPTKKTKSVAADKPAKRTK